MKNARNETAMNGNNDKCGIEEVFQFHELLSTNSAAWVSFYSIFIVYETIADFELVNHSSVLAEYLLLLTQRSWPSPACLNQWQHTTNVHHSAQHMFPILSWVTDNSQSNSINSVVVNKKSVNVA